MISDVYMKDTDGNIGYESTNVTEQNCGLIFDISGQADFWTHTNDDFKAKWENNVVELTEFKEAVEAGITPFTGTNDILAGVPYYHINQFFGMVGGKGRLWVMFADCSSNWDALIEMQQASGGIISQFGVWTEQSLWKNMDSTSTSYSISIVGDIESKMQSMAKDYFAPASVLLCANTAQVKTNDGVEKAVTFSKIPDAIIDARYVSVLLGQAVNYDPDNTWQNVQKMQGSLASTTPVGTVGLALGTLVRCRVSESLAWVGPFNLVNYIPAIEMGFGDATLEGGELKNRIAYSALKRSQMDELDEKGYIFLRKYAGAESAVFFSRDQTCSHGDYCTIARNRAINKSRRMVRAALLPYVNSPIKVDPSTGNLAPAQVTFFYNLIADALRTMETGGEISGIGQVVVPATQNILVTRKLNFSYSIIPFGTAEVINVEEGLALKQ